MVPYGAIARRFGWGSFLLAARHPDDAPTRPADLAQSRLVREFETFFARYEPEITAYLWRLTGSEQSACDLCQETFLRAWQHFATLQTYEKPIAWLMKVATNLAWQHLRKAATPLQTALPLDVVGDPATSDHGPHVVERDLIMETLLALAPRSRAVLVLSLVHGQPGAVIAETLGMSHAAVKMALWRACAQFREIYIRKGGQA